MNPADSAIVELDSLIELFFSDPAQLGNFESVDVAQIPSPSLELLAHNRHMTVTVEKHHGCSVEVKVLEHRTDGEHYSRKILLRRQSDNGVVQFGIVRLCLPTVSEPVRDEIQSRKIPLGRVLIKHDVLREVKVLGLFRIICGPELAKEFGREIGDVCYGRTAIIYCDGRPAIELLEIVTD